MSRRTCSSSAEAVEHCPCPSRQAEHGRQPRLPSMTASRSCLRSSNESGMAAASTFSSASAYNRLRMFRSGRLVLPLSRAESADRETLHTSLKPSLRPLPPKPSFPPPIRRQSFRMAMASSRCGSPRWSSPAYSPRFGNFGSCLDNRLPVWQGAGCPLPGHSAAAGRSCRSPSVRSSYPDSQGLPLQPAVSLGRSSQPPSRPDGMCPPGSSGPAPARSRPSVQ